MTDLETWLTSDDPVLRRHAEYVLSNGAVRNPVAVGPVPVPSFAPCEHRGVMVESGAGCGCGPKHLCGRFVKVVSAADCRACVSAADDTERGSELGE